MPGKLKKPYRLVASEHKMPNADFVEGRDSPEMSHGTALTGDICHLTDTQYRAFRDKFVPADQDSNDVREAERRKFAEAQERARVTGEPVDPNRPMTAEQLAESDRKIAEQDRIREAQGQLWARNNAHQIELERSVPAYASASQLPPKPYGADMASAESDRALRKLAADRAATNDATNIDPAAPAAPAAPAGAAPLVPPPPPPPQPILGEQTSGPHRVTPGPAGGGPKK